MPIRVAIVENNEEICATLERIVGRANNLRCVCSCPNGETALQTIPQHAPEVVVMDIRLPDISGIECTARLKRLLPETQVLVFTVTKEIADKLSISFDTVRFHLKHVYQKLHVRSRAEAVVKYLR